MLNLDVLGPFQVVKRSLTLQPRDAKPATGPPRAGPLAWWNFDDAQGTTVANAAGDQFQGKIQGQPRWSQGPDKTDGALEFDGARNWVDCAESAGLELRDSVSVSAWFKVRQFDQASQTLIAKGEAWRLQRQGEKGGLEFALAGPQATGANKTKPPTVSTQRAVDDGQWHHVVGVYDGQRIAVYLDGVEEGALAVTGPVAVNTSPVTLGDNDATRGRFFNGWLADARLYSRGLSPEEVRTLHQGRGK